MKYGAKNEIRQRALELGFDECGFTTAAPLESAGRFREWLAAGRHGKMEYLERTADKRIDPRVVLPGAEAIIVVAASYCGDCRRKKPIGVAAEQTTDRLPNGTGAHASVARYARFRDYHEVIGKQLDKLVEFVNALGGPGTRSVGHVDKGPVLERGLAQRAGIGFVGKHTNLISRNRGNWFFLAEVLTTLRIEPDAPEQNRCGTCMRCLNACPTGAIVAPFELDARRCLSYLTIELRGSIPVDLRSLLGSRVFGCDTCLEVCPWNRFSRSAALMASERWNTDGFLDPVELLGLDQAEFDRRFGQTPISRVRLTGLRRNACVALGNAGDSRAMVALQRAASDQDQIVAEHARWAIDRIADRLRIST